MLYLYVPWECVAFEAEWSQRILSGVGGRLRRISFAVLTARWKASRCMYMYVLGGSYSVALVVHALKRAMPLAVYSRESCVS